MLSSRREHADERKTSTLASPSSAAAPSARVDVSTLAGSTGATSARIARERKERPHAHPVLSRYEHVVINIGARDARVVELPVVKVLPGATTSPSRRARARLTRILAVDDKEDLRSPTTATMRSSGCGVRLKAFCQSRGRRAATALLTR